MKISISDWIAIIFGIISSLGLIYTVWSKWNERKEKVEVKTSFGFFTYGRHVSKEYYLFLECINHGETNVYLSSCNLTLPDKKTIPAFFQNPFGDNFPFQLDSGKNFRYAFNVDHLIDTMIKQGYKHEVEITPYFFSERNKKFRGKSFVLPLT